MKIKPLLHAALSAAALCLSAGAAHAGLVGTTVSQCANTAYSGSVTTDTAACASSTVQPTPTSAVVGGGVEFSVVSTGHRFLDFSDTTLVLDYLNAGSSSPDLFIFDLEPMLFGVSIVGANVLNVTFTFVGDKLGVLVNSPLANGTVTLSLDTQGGTVPEPATLPLAALALWAAARNRRKA